MTSDKLEGEFQYYLQHQKELLSKYNGQFVVIRGKEVIGAYSSEIEAYEETQKNFKLGTFLIQEVGEGPENYTHTFYSQVAF